MLNNEWTQVAGFSNMGENDESIFAKKVGSTTSVAYAAYGGIKVVELSGVSDFCQFKNNETDFSVVISECGDDWELAVPVLSGDSNVIVVIDDNSNVSVIPMDDGTDVEVITCPVVESSEEYDADSMEDLDDEELLRCFHLM